MAHPKHKKNKHSAKPVVAAKSPADKRKILPYVLVCILATLLVFTNALNNDFCWDDGGYIVENPVIRDISSKQGLKTVLTQDYGGNYHPATAVVNALEYKYFGLNPKPYHAINLMFHVLNVLLVFLFIRRLTFSIEIATIVALLFGIHPMRVESVTWIAELKDVMYTFFFLLSILAYLNYVSEKKWKHLFYSLLLFFLSGASKSAAVCLPPVLLLLDYYRGRKLNINVFIEKIPHFAIALFWGIYALKSQGDVGSFADLTKTYNLLDRFFLVCYAIMFYIVKLFVPIAQTVAHIYPAKENGAFPIQFYLAPVGVVLLVFTVFKGGKWKKELLFSLLFYLITVALVLQIIPVGKTVVSERYSYMPYLGLFLFIGKFAHQYQKENVLSPWKIRIIPSTVLGIFVIISGILTWNRNQVWENDIALFTDVLEKNPRVDFAYNNRGNIYFKQNDFTRAFADYQKAVEINPEYADAVYSRGVCKEKLNDLKGAIDDYNRALTLNIKPPTLYYAYNNRGNVKGKLKDTLGALVDYDKALELNPDYVDAYFNRGGVKDTKGDYTGALKDYNEFIRRRTDYHPAFFNRGKIKIFLKDYKGALEDYNIVLQMNPNYPEAYFNRGYAAIYSGRKQEACGDFVRALQGGVAKAKTMIDEHCK